ncbi:MAG: two-component regulator propeller domain-containing protein, partial [Parabacteroides sp.]|nr:two-component regulator propeller domain-containing protein [Parabacteroides sp.]
KLKTLGIHEQIQQLFVDEDNNLWCISDKNVYYYDFTLKQLSTIGLTSQLVVCDMDCRHSKGYLLLKDGSIAYIDKENKSIQSIARLEYNFSTLTPRIYIDKKQRIWIYSTHGYEISCYSIKDNAWISFPGQEKLTKEHCNITALTDDSKGNIWIGTDNNGIIIAQFDKQTYTQLCKDYTHTYSLPCNHITTIYEDENNLMWIGTGKQGVSYTNLNKIEIKNHLSYRQEDISSLFEDEQGSLWLGFDGEGIARYDIKENIYHYYNQKNKSIPSDLIVSSFYDSQGRLWWSSFGGGVFYYQNGKFTLPTLKPTSSITEWPQYIRRIAEDGNKNLWFATYSQGLYKWEPTGNLKAFHTENSPLITNYS